MAAPPAYEEAPPAYPALQQPEHAVPPAAFDQYAPATVVIHQPSAPPQAHIASDNGENYTDTPQQSAQAANIGIGESSAQKQIIVYVQPHANQYPAQAQYFGAGNYNRQYEQPRTTNPEDLFAFKIKDHRVNAFGTGPNCVCCCHLQLAAYLLLVIFILFNGFSIENHIVGTHYTESGYELYDYMLAVYFGINIIINIVCFMGVLKCKSKWIRPQSWICLSYIIIAIMNTILSTIILDDMAVMSIFNVLFTLGFVLWFTSVFHRIYRWAYYFEHGGPYVREMYKPPKKNQMVPQIQPSQHVQMQPIPQDGNL